MSTPKPVIFGISGTSVSDEDREFYSKLNPLGFAVFKKNLIDKAQSKKLCEELRLIVGRKDAPILIDQEGGAVNRLTAPTWRIPPSPLSLGKLAYSGISNALEKTIKLVNLNAKLIAYEMKEIGVNVNCAPVADLLIQGAHHITSTRSFGPSPFITSKLVNSMAEGLKAGGVQAIMKHMLGQGRAAKDSHLELPVVKENLDVLEAGDFSVFRNAKDIKWGMPAHIIYEALDPKQIVTYSKKTIDYIRTKICFDGILISDCVTMKALPESWGERAFKAINAGLDLVFFGGCKFEILNEIAQNVPNLSEDDFKRIQNSFDHLANQPAINYQETLAEYIELLKSMESEFEKILETKFSEELKLIISVLHGRSDLNADYSSPLFKA